MPPLSEPIPHSSLYHILPVWWNRKLWLSVLGVVWIACIGYHSIQPVWALPAHIVVDTPETLATFHCRQIYASAKDNMLLTTDSLNSLAGEGQLETLLSPEEVNKLRQEFGIAPDFGFLLPGRWNAMTRDERLRFNLLMAAFLRHIYHLPTDGTVVDKCHAKRLTPVAAGNPNQPMQHVRFAKTALTTLGLNGNPGFVPVVYLFNRADASERWQMSDMQIAGVSLRQHMETLLPERMAKGGFSQLFDDLQDIVDEKREVGEYFPR